MLFTLVLGCLFFCVQLQSSLVLWVVLEVISLSVLFGMLLVGGSVKPLTGLINYFLVQAVGGLMLLVSLLAEIGLHGNFFFFYEPSMSGSLLLAGFGLIVKLGLFPFYWQIIYVFSYLEGRQCFMMSTYPKVLPMVYLGLLMDFYSMGAVLLVSGVSILLGGFFGMFSTSVKELLGWSTIGHSGWMFFSLIGGIFFFLFYIFFYSLILKKIWVKLSLSQDNYFMSSGGTLGLGQGGLYYLLLLVLMLGGFAPLLGFLVKLAVVNWMLTKGFSVSVLVVLLFFTTSALFFYSRMLQFLSSVNGSYVGSLVFTGKVGGLGLTDVLYLGLLLGLFGVVFF